MRLLLLLSRGSVQFRTSSSATEYVSPTREPVKPNNWIEQAVKSVSWSVTSASQLTLSLSPLQSTARHKCHVLRPQSCSARFEVSLKHGFGSDGRHQANHCRDNAHS
jgi:hypothetical protein